MPTTSANTRGKALVNLLPLEQGERRAGIPGGDTPPFTHQLAG